MNCNALVMAPLNLVLGKEAPLDMLLTLCPLTCLDLGIIIMYIHVDANYGMIASSFDEFGHVTAMS